MMSKFYYKTIRTDESNFWEQFELEILGITKEPLRVYSDDRSKEWIVRQVTRPVEHIDNPLNDIEYEVVQFSGKEAYPKELKDATTKQQSMSFCDTAWDQLPPVFGFGNRKILVGVCFDYEHVLPRRIFAYDGGTYERPYAFLTQEKARRYLDNKLKNQMLLKRLDDIKNNLTSYNEVQGRARFHHIAPLRIMIFTDNPESRLLAICRKRSLELTTQQHHPASIEVKVKIEFYPKAPYAEPHEYTLAEQRDDIAKFKRTPVCLLYIDVLTHFLPEQPSQQGSGRTAAGGGSTAFTASSSSSSNHSSSGLSPLSHEQLIAMAPIALKLGTLVQQKFMTMIHREVKTLAPQLQMHYTPNMWASRPHEQHPVSDEIVHKHILHYTAKGQVRELSHWLNQKNMPLALNDRQRQKLIEDCSRHNNHSCLNIILGKMLTTSKPPNHDRGESLSNQAGALHIACEMGHLEVVQLLLGREEVDVNRPIQGGWTPLHFACQDGHLKIIQLLLSAPKIKVNQPENYGNTPLYHACQHDFHSVVELLLKDTRVDANLAANGTTPLYVACQNGHLEVVKLLLRSPKINVNQNNSRWPFWNKKGTPLHIACQNIHIEILDLLLRMPGIAVNQAMEDGRTPLYHACQNGHLEVVKLLLGSPAINVNLAMTLGYTPLRIACHHRHRKVVKLLLGQQSITQSLEKLYASCGGSYRMQLSVFTTLPWKNPPTLHEIIQTLIKRATHDQHGASAKTLRELDIDF